jgi:alanine racemase
VAAGLTPPGPYRPTWAEVDLDALLHNLGRIRGRLGDRPLLAVVKADAYGHGAVPVARTLEKAGVEHLGVALPEEGIELRRAGVRTPILLLGGCAPEQADLVLGHDLTAAVYRREQVEAIRAAAARRGVTARVHLKVDTGMGRLGVPAGEVGAFADVFVEAAGGRVRLEGAYSHFAVADDPRDPFTARQIELFLEAVESLRARGLDPPLLHLANSAAITDHPPAWLTLARPGIILYGYPPSDRVVAGDWRPVLSLRTRIIYLKDLPAGASLGYGRTWVAGRPSRIASLPAGYDDGIPRILGNRGHVLVHGRPAPIVGRVSMDLTTVNVSGIPDVRLGDTVTILGSDGAASLGADQIASWAGTIPWDILCGVGPRVPRFHRRGAETGVVSRFGSL